MGITTVTVGYKFESVENAQKWMDVCIVNQWVKMEGPQVPSMYYLPSLAELRQCGNTHFEIKSEVETYKGCVIKTFYKDVRIMSDVWEMHTFAEVWDFETFSVKEVFISGESNRMDGIFRSVIIDATPEVLEVVRFWKFGKDFRNAEISYDIAQQKDYQLRKTPNKGKWVEVVKGKKVPRGTKGLVFWIGVDNWGNSKVGVAVSPERNNHGGYVDVVWTQQSNCTVLNTPLW